MRDGRAPFASFIESFLASSRLAPKSRSDYRRYLAEFDEFTGTTSAQEALTVDNARKWIIGEVTKRGPWAAKNATAVLKSMASWFKKTGYLVGLGGTNVLYLLEPAPTPASPTHHVFTESQLEAIWQVLSARSTRERYRSIAYVRLLNAAGLRTTEARSLLLDDLELNRGSVTVRATTSARDHSGEKSVRRRIDSKTVAAVREYIKNERPKYIGKADEPLFITETGMPFRPDGFGAWTRRIAIHIKRATGITWTSRLMRHTWKEESEELIRDDELRRRCDDLLSADGDHDRAVREACTVLESRVRAAIKAPNRLIGKNLMDAAFWGSPPVALRLSDHDGEQEGAWQMYRGLMAFYRNPVGHRIRDDLDRSEALHIVYWIDHLLALLTQATL